MKGTKQAVELWGTTNFIFGAGWLVYSLYDNSLPAWMAIPAALIAMVVSLPILIILKISLPVIQKSAISRQGKKLCLLAVCAVCCAIYALFGVLIFGSTEGGNILITWTRCVIILLASASCAMLILSKSLSSFFVTANQLTIKPYKPMETIHDGTASSRSNKILIKSLITGALILVMLIPTIFISNLVDERQARQTKVVTEVSNRWAQAQVLTGPYVYLPYKIVMIDKDHKSTEQLNHLIILPDNLEVNGQIFHELRLRSIYKVLLYKATLHNSGNFEFKIPGEIDKSLIQWQDAKICYGFSDFKGIEEKLVVNFKGLNYELSPSLPSDEISEKGLSTSIPLTISDEGKRISFQINLKIKGSEQLHFIPLGGDSRFTLRSSWNNPSFDGNNLPSVRTVNDSGFIAMWNFNKANLPFGTILKDFKYDLNSIAFGVTMVQTADGYAKTNRCIKYAILFIGLTFSLFFIIELMQKKPVHPVQYILIGMALIIFYTLLLSISEFMIFDLSYLIAAAATILLIASYAYGHFKSIKTAGVFAGVLTLLYSFTFILIRLEDTALLIGSIGLFIILVLAMHASKKINWYGEEAMPLTTK